MNHLDLIAGFVPAPRFTTAVVEADKLAAELGLPQLTKIAVSTDWVRKAVSQSSPPPRRALGSMANHFTSKIEGASGAALKKRDVAIEALEQKLSALTPELREALRSAVAKHPELKEKKAAATSLKPAKGIKRVGELLTGSRAKKLEDAVGRAPGRYDKIPRRARTNNPENDHRRATDAINRISQHTEARKIQAGAEHSAVSNARQNALAGGALATGYVAGRVHKGTEKKAAVKIAVPLSSFLPAAKKVTSIGKTTMRGVPGAVPNLNEFKSVLKPKPAITNARQALASDHPRAGVPAIAAARPSAGKVISRGVGVIA